MLHNRDIVIQSRATLRGNWGLAIGGTALYCLSLMVAGVISGLGPVLHLVLGGPMAAGFSLFCLKYMRNEKPEIGDVFSGFSNFLNAMVAYLLCCLYVILWGLLLIVPGIIAAIGYAQTFFIIAENPKMSGPDALRRSKDMMKGFKSKYFFLLCRYIGWSLLGCATLGIGFIWILPMIYMALTKFYDELKTDYEARTPREFTAA